MEGWAGGQFPRGLVEEDPQCPRVQTLHWPCPMVQPCARHMSKATSHLCPTEEMPAVAMLSADGTHLGT